MSQFKRPSIAIAIPYVNNDPLLHTYENGFLCGQEGCICWTEERDTLISLSAAFQRDPGLLSRHHHIFERKRITAQLGDPTPTLDLSKPHPQALPIIDVAQIDTLPVSTPETQRKTDAWVGRLKRFFRR